MMWRIVSPLVLVIACNTASDLRRWYVPLENSSRTLRATDQIILLHHEPADRAFILIGIFEPPPEAFLSIGEAMNGARRAAALYGADAVIVDSAESVSLQRVSALEPSSGVKIEARAIVWR